MLFLNGASATDGCRVNISPLMASIDRGHPLEQCLDVPTANQAASIVPTARLDATVDLYDFMCNQEDVRLITAAALSARFPYVLPAGRVADCHENSTRHVVYDIDGGYYQSAGAATLLDLWRGLEPLVTEYNALANAAGEPNIVPTALLIDNHYLAPSSPSVDDPGPPGLAIPLLGVASARDAHDASDAQALAAAFSGPVPGVANEGPRFASIYPSAHPGFTAPLGWALAEASREDLQDQLKQIAAQPDGPVQRVLCWLNDQLPCLPAS